VFTILVIDDERSILQSLKGILSDEGYQTLLAENGKEGLEICEKEVPDVVLLDIAMPGMDGMEVLKRIKEVLPFVPVIIMTGHGSIDMAVKAIKLGSYDFLEKPLEMDKLLLTVKNAIDYGNLQRENLLLKQKIEKQHNLIGNSPAVQILRKQIEQVAPTDAWVLIFGENGSGKEVVAHEIHRQSQRHRKPFVEVNCAAIPEELIESELFGHEKGAFTGATSSKRGKFDMAHEGTLFLDEIGDMSLKTQAKILRILEEQRFERVGGNKTIQVDVRVIAATNKNLEEEIKRGTFREDLYFRLRVIDVILPALRERGNDIFLLASHFIDQIAHKIDKEINGMSVQTAEILKCYSWPGNVRELEHVMERSCVLCQGPTIVVEHLPEEIVHLQHSQFHAQAQMRPRESPMTVAAAIPASTPPAQILDAMPLDERIIFALTKTGGNKAKAARLLGIDRTTLYRKIKELNIDLTVLDI